MKAVSFFEHGPVDVLQYKEDCPDPEAGKGDVIINVEYCGVNHLDIWTRQGIAGKRIRLPHISGCDIMGTVEGKRVMVYPGISCGKCQHCRAGRENLCRQFAIIGGMSDHDGGYAEKAAVPLKNIIRLSGSMKSETAAALSVSYLVAWNMLLTNGAGKGKTLLVYGATSGVGMATIQLAKALGSKVITTVSGKQKHDFAKKLGAHHVINRTTQSIVEEAGRLTKGNGVDIVIDHVGAATWPTSIAALKHGGRMAVCGMTSGNEAVVPVRMFYSKQITMTGAMLGSKSQLLELVNFVNRKKIQPVIDSVFQLKDAREAQKSMEADLHAGKILLKC